MRGQESDGGYYYYLKKLNLLASQPFSPPPETILSPCPGLFWPWLFLPSWHLTSFDCVYSTPCYFAHTFLPSALVSSFLLFILHQQYSTISPSNRSLPLDASLIDGKARQIRREGIMSSRLVIHPVLPRVCAPRLRQPDQQE